MNHFMFMVDFSEHRLLNDEIKDLNIRLEFLNNMLNNVEKQRFNENLKVTF